MDCRNLGENELTEIAADTLNTLTNLRNLSLHDNELRCLSNDTIRAANELVEL